MNRKILCLVILMVSIFLMVGCCGNTPPISTNMTGNWTMTNLAQSTNNPVHTIGSTTTAKCYISDNYGSLTISNFRLIDQEGIKWSTGYGSFNKPTISATINGNYINMYDQTVTTVIYFEGEIGSAGISGIGSWVQTMSVSGYTWITSGSTIFVKG